MAAISQFLPTARVPMPKWPTPSPSKEPTPLQHRSHQKSISGFPRPLTTFIGREHQVAAVRTLLARDDVRLLSLTGPGGVGKTRLAMTVAEQYDGFPDGLWFVTLASIRDPALVAPTIARALDVPRNPAHSASKDLTDALRDQRGLLILDNFEQVLDASHLIVNLLAHCARLKLLVTSRSILRVSGEHVFSVPSLDLPNTNKHLDLGTTRSIASVRLFVERARASSANFDLTTDNARTIAEICRRLDGLPLAIELAAARMNVFSANDLLRRLDSRLPLLTEGARDQPPRLQSLHASIAWSYELLPPREQALFRHLAVLAEPWPLEVAEALVREIGDAAVPSVLDEMTSLIEQSLVRQFVAPNGESRYVMLHMIREYALMQLDQNGEADRVRDAHAAAFLGIATEGEAHLLQSVDPAWLDRLEANHQNLRDALAWTFSGSTTSATERGVRLAGALWLFWYYHSHLIEGRDWLKRALGAGNDVPNHARTKVLLGLGTIMHYLGEKHRAQALLSEGLELSRRLGDRWMTAFIMTACGNLAEDEGHYDEAAEHFGGANLLFSEIGDDVNVAVTLYHLGVVAFGQGDLERSLARCREGLALAREASDPWTTAACLGYLGLVWNAREEPANAAAALGEALTIYRRFDSPERIAEMLSRIAILAHAHGDPATALRLFSVAETLGDRIGVHQELPERETYAQALSAIRLALAPDDYTRLRLDGQMLSLDEAIAEAESVIHDATPPVPTVHTSSDIATARPVAPELSPREREVLSLLVLGKTDQQIADQLFISRRTVATHVAHIYTKLAVSSRAEAAATAVRSGLA